LSLMSIYGPRYLYRWCSNVSEPTTVMRGPWWPCGDAISVHLAPPPSRSPPCAVLSSCLFACKFEYIQL
jgi:hypothetical protein